MKKLISILGSTGSIGLTTLKILDKKKMYLKPYLFSANKNYKLICKQIVKYKPDIFIINDEFIFKKVKKKFIKNKIKLYNTFHLKNVSRISDISVSAIPGIAGLQPTTLMIKKSKKILLANKESIICGWSLIKNLASKHKTKIIPVDSEHFSIQKLFENSKLNEIEKVYLTASGGPFLGFKTNQLKKIKPSKALKHPKWKMGEKISIDSSTLMNKVLEFIEAQKLFDLPYKKLDILIHPESLVHAIIKYKNGLTKFIYHETSMIVPIANAIFDKNLKIDEFLKNKKNIKNLTFSSPKKSNFPIINLLDKVNYYPSSSIIVNASNEVLVEHFLREKIPFLDIPLIINKILRDRNYKKYAIRKPMNINQISKINIWAKLKTLEKIKAKYG